MTLREEQIIEANGIKNKLKEDKMKRSLWREEIAIFLILILLCTTFYSKILWSIDLKIRIVIIIIFLYFVAIILDLFMSYKARKIEKKAKEKLRKATKETYSVSPTHRHFNSLLWQVPSWGIAISAGVIVAANQLDNYKWTFSVEFVKTSILLFGTFLLGALVIAVFKYRVCHAASIDSPPPHPPSGTNPKANPFLQGAICLTLGGVFGLALAQFLSSSWLIVNGFIIGALVWILLEIHYKSVVEQIKKSYKPRSNQAR